MNKKKDYFFYGFFFLIFSFYTVFDLRNDNSLIFFLLIVIICIATDMGGYIFGKTFKGPKLTKKISPNKTYAGMLGGFFLTIIFSYIFLNNFNLLGLEDSGEMPEQIYIIALLTSFISQAGDLIVSFFKRKAKIKNTGKIIPGHGGLLDRIDGMIFAFPFIYVITKIL
tara:strand:- start:1050 stop:1553 length:504 start_codon:yes stop_codon:yes gene_type:complete